MSDSEDPIDPIDEGGDDLFGDEPDEGDEGATSPKERVLEDDDLASDPDGDTYARYRDQDDQARDEDEVRERIVVDITTYRHPIPKPSDGTVSLHNCISFLQCNSLRGLHLATSPSCTKVYPVPSRRVQSQDLPTVRAGPCQCPKRAPTACRTLSKGLQHWPLT